MHRELWKADRELPELSIESSFQQIHHFSSERFASSPSTLHQFEKYSEGVSDFEDGENAQTIRRALAVVENVRDGSSLDDAIADAWRTFPLVTR